MAPDPRLTPARGGVAAAGLKGVAPADRYVEPRPFICIRDRAALRAEPRPGAEQVNQLLFGEPFDLLEESAGWALGQAGRDGYVGYLEADALQAPPGPPTHWVSALRTYAFPEPDFKSAPPRLLSINSLLRVRRRDGRYLEAEGAGWIVDAHLRPVGEHEADPATVAERFENSPYLWGGRDSLGLDCSGLVQQALFACGKACPRDSDMQASLGREIARDELHRGDLVFWPGHVALMLDAERLIHANGWRMAVTIEPLEDAIARIEAAGEGPPVAFRRLDP